MMFISLLNLWDCVGLMNCWYSTSFFILFCKQCYNTSPDSQNLLIIHGVAFGEEGNNVQHRLFCPPLSIFNTVVSILYRVGHLNCSKQSRELKMEFEHAQNIEDCLAPHILT